MKKRTREDGGSSIDRLRGLLAIDKHSLDDEIVQQPQKFFEISESFVEAAARRDYCKEEVKRIDADLATKHRKLIEKSGARATDASVTTAVTADQEHKDAVDAHLEANQQAELLGALKEAFHQRSYMIRDLSSLFIANYYEKTAVNGNSATRDIKANAAMDKMAAKRSQREK